MVEEDIFCVGVPTLPGSTISHICTDSIISVLLFSRKNTYMDTYCQMLQQTYMFRAFTTIEKDVCIVGFSNSSNHKLVIFYGVLQGPEILNPKAEQWPLHFASFSSCSPPFSSNLLAALAPRYEQKVSCGWRAVG